MTSFGTRMVCRQIVHSGGQALIFVLCTMLSIMVLVAVNGLTDSAQRTLFNDARKLHGADIIVRSNLPISESVRRVSAALVSEGRIESAATRQFLAVARTMDEDRSLMVSVKAVTPTYPLYGEVLLASDRPFKAVLQPGQVVVERSFLDRIDLVVGERLRLGQATLTVADVITQEPNRPVNLFSLGPRMIVPAADLERLQLISQASRVRYQWLIKLSDPMALQSVYDQIKQVAASDERVDTFETAESRLKRFFDHLFFFLSLIGVLTLLLAGVGIQSTLAAILKQKENTIAIMKTVGATWPRVMIHFLAMALVLGAAGTVLGTGAGLLLERWAMHLFPLFLPPEGMPSLSLRVIVESILLGLGGVMLFCAIPLYNLKAIKPARILGKSAVPERGSWIRIIPTVVVTALLVGMVLWQLQDAEFGLYLLEGVLVLIIVSALWAWITLKILAKLPFGCLSLRQAVKGLFRPGNLTRAIIATLTAALAALFCIFLVERNLHRTFVASFPEDAPNLFFIDIQSHQREAFQAAMPETVELYPIVRARLDTINGNTIDREAQRQRRGDNLARPFNLTYRGHLLDDERLIKGPGLFDPRLGAAQVSVLNTVLEMHPIKIGDRLGFNVQGVPLLATVTSVRTRQRETVSPFFYFVFPAELLASAPQTLFGAVRVSPDQVAALQSRVVAALPNVSVLDVSAAVHQFSAVARRLSTTVRFFSAFSLLAGLFIVVASVMATRLARTREAVYFQVLGARAGFVLKVFALENMLIGAISATGAVIMAQAAAWVVCRFGFELSYRSYPTASVLLIAATVPVVVGVGLIACRTIIAKKPAAILERQF
jgi:putative ABC transport system permease protein